MKTASFAGILMLAAGMASAQTPASPFGRDTDAAVGAALKTFRDAGADRLEAERQALKARFQGAMAQLDAVSADVASEYNLIHGKAADAYVKNEGYDRWSAFASAERFLRYVSYFLIRQGAKKVHVQEQASDLGYPLALERSVWRAEEAVEESRKALEAYQRLLKPRVESGDAQAIADGADALENALDAVTWLTYVDGIEAIRSQGRLKGLAISSDGPQVWVTVEITDVAAAPAAKRAIAELGEKINMPAPIYVGLVSALP